MDVLIMSTDVANIALIRSKRVYIRSNGAPVVTFAAWWHRVAQLMLSALTWERIALVWGRKMELKDK